MDVNDDTGSLTPRAILKPIASGFAPTETPGRAYGGSVRPVQKPKGYT
jgi:hypothetical protein